VSFFGPKCARCGQRRTKREYEGLPTCETCEKLIEAKIKAAKEQAHRCPLDGAQMAKEIVLNLIIDRCPSCRGVWLDGGELEEMRGAIERGMAQQIIRGMAFPPPI
jgi:ribosomal protein L37AE/L43A